VPVAKEKLKNLREGSGGFLSIETNLTKKNIFATNQRVEIAPSATQFLPPSLYY
jgi:hypothetical protein